MSGFLVLDRFRSRRSAYVNFEFERQMFDVTSDHADVTSDHPNVSLHHVYATKTNIYEDIQQLTSNPPSKNHVLFSAFWKNSDAYGFPSTGNTMLTDNLPPCTSHPKIAVTCAHALACIAAPQGAAQRGVAAAFAAKKNNQNNLKTNNNNLIHISPSAFVCLFVCRRTPPKLLDGMT